MTVRSCRKHVLSWKRPSPAPVPWAGKQRLPTRPSATPTHRAPRSIVRPPPARGASGGLSADKRQKQVTVPSYRDAVGMAMLLPAVASRSRPAPLRRRLGRAREDAFFPPAENQHPRLPAQRSIAGLFSRGPSGTRFRMAAAGPAMNRWAILTRSLRDWFSDGGCRPSDQSLGYSHAVPPGPGLCPVGTCGNSPAVHCWVGRRKCFGRLSPVGTTEFHDCPIS